MDHENILDELGYIVIFSCPFKVLELVSYIPYTHKYILCIIYTPYKQTHPHHMACRFRTSKSFFLKFKNKKIHFLKFKKISRTLLAISNFKKKNISSRTFSDLQERVATLIYYFIC